MIKPKNYLNIPFMALMLSGGSLLLSSCYDYMPPRHPHGAPPGQVKNFYGDKGHPHGGPPGQMKKLRY